jgi:biopolymer transport protein ExbB/TolQ
MAIIIPILTQFDDKGIKSAVREFERAKTGLDKFGATGKIFSEVGTTLTKNLTVPILAVGGALGFMIKEAIEAEAVTSRLRQILITTGGATNAQVDALLKQAAALEKVGVASRESIVTTQSQLATFDLQADTISALTPAILDYVLAEKGATATSDDFKSMTNGLAQALNGQFGSLTRVGFVLDEDTKKKIANGTESERAAALVEVLNSTYKGFNESLLATPEGRIIALQREFGDLRQELGSVFLPIAMEISGVIKDRVIPEIQKLVDKFKALSPETVETGLKVLALIGVLGPLLVVIGKVIGAIQIFIGVFKVLSLVLLANPIYAVAALLAVLVVAFIHAFQTSDKFRQGVQKLGNAFINFAEGALNFVIDHMNLFLKGMNIVIKGLQMFGVDVKEVGQIAPVALKRISLSTVEASNNMGALAAQTDTLSTDVSDYLVPSLGKMNKGLEKSSEELKKVKEAAKGAAQVVVDNLEDALRKAESALDDVRGKFTNFKNAIGSTITGILDFGKAAESEDFLKGLADQATKATLFADKVKQLVVLGLNERAIRQVLDAGFDAGSKIADSIIIGGATVVDQVNTLVDSIFNVADQVGEFGAVAFYDAGVKQAEAMVAGIKAALEQARGELKGIVDSLATTAPTGGGAPSAPTTEQRKTDTGTKLQPGQLLTSTQFAKAANVLKTSGTAAASYTALAYALQNKTIRMAKGGIVTGPTNALIGEAGPEAVIPLSGANSVGMGSTYNINVNAGIGTNGAQVGRDIVEAIRKYERTSGQVFVRV